ncbi:MAG: hypothetical protein V4689_14295 [Verrucomicrobiota bacterium]
MEMLRRTLSHRNVRIGLVGLLAAGLLAGWLAWQMGLDLAGLKEAWTKLNDYLVKNPAALFFAMVFLPGLPFPMSALLFTAGVVWRHQPMMAVLLTNFAVALNLTWTYWLAAGPARRLVEKFLSATAIQIPDLPRGDHLKLILVLKLTPGIPFFFQNYLLGFLRAPFMLYLPISILSNGIIGTGVVLSGVGLADGRLMPAITGVSLIVVGVVLTQLIRGWLAKKKRVLVGKVETLEG